MLVTPWPMMSLTEALLVALDGPLIQKPDVINVKPTSNGNARERRASLSAATARLTRPGGTRPVMAGRYQEQVGQDRCQCDPRRRYARARRVELEERVDEVDRPAVPTQ